MFTPNQKRNIGKILPFGILWLVFGLLYAFLEKGLLGDLKFYPTTQNAYDFGNSLIVTATGTLIMGLIMGTFEVLYLSKKFANQSFGIKFFLKNLIYLFAICTFLILLTFTSNSFAMDLSPFDPLVMESMSNFLFTSFVFWSIVLYTGAMIAITLFVSEISDNLGQGVLVNFLTGKYHKPRVEERIFMFLDMKASTTIAEKLGHVRYYELLNEYYADITGAILQTAGRIYQYVGDEVIVRWSIKDGIRDNNCLNCFFLIKRILKDKANKYHGKYGVVPGFKAGFHYGKVTMGEIGVVKKEIIFTGDVLNTTARIQGLCNSFEVDLLLSEDLLNLLDNSGEYQSKEIGETELRGREEKINLFTVSEK